MELHGAFNTGCLEGISKEENIQRAFFMKLYLLKNERNVTLNTFSMTEEIHVF